MTDTQLKKLKDDLQHSADMLRASAHLAANKYGQPIWGLIFLCYADILFKQHKAKIAEEHNRKGDRRNRERKSQYVWHVSQGSLRTICTRGRTRTSF